MIRVHRELWRRTLALFVCASLFLFVVLGAAVHRHDDNASSTACHICQTAHLPALTTNAPELIRAPELVAWHIPLPPSTAPVDSFALHFASRAPPAA